MLIVLIGVIAGGASWGVVSLVSDGYEPFDNDLGFYLGQSILSAIALWVGYKSRYVYLIIYLLSAYLGMNAYSYIFGGSEQRTWAMLGMITTLSLIVIPSALGVIGKIVCFMQRKCNRRNPADVGTSAQER